MTAPAGILGLVEKFERHRESYESSAYNEPQLRREFLDPMRLFELFERADDRYNSGLFHFKAEKGRAERPDELTPRLKLDDDGLQDIIGDLYLPKSPYAFSVISADILGAVYEQFLGKVIRLTAGHHVKVEEKPEVRKAGGVYYTPTYIVDQAANEIKIQKLTAAYRMMILTLALILLFSLLYAVHAWTGGAGTG